MAERCTDAQRKQREQDALEMLSSGAGSAFTAATLAERYGVSLRQARRYVAAASFELVDAATPHELDRQAMLSLHRLDLIAGRAMAAGDEALAVRATRCHAAALAQFRRAISAPQTRFRLPTTGTPDGGIDTAELPF
jgi:predicted DNA-binding transcriptional regulator YafY